MADAEKTCPRCREKVKLLASLCKHCGYEFTANEMAEARRLDAASQRSFGLGCFLVVVLVLMLAVCGKSKDSEVAKSDVPATYEPSKEPSAPSSKYGDTGKQYAWIANGKDQIKAQLKDPSSAEFRNVRFYSGGGIPVTCGQVNAKNSYGGFTGFERFVAAGSEIAVTESMVDGGLDEVWQKYCIRGSGDEAYSD